MAAKRTKKQSKPKKHKKDQKAKPAAKAKKAQPDRKPKKAKAAAAPARSSTKAKAAAAPKGAAPKGAAPKGAAPKGAGAKGARAQDAAAHGRPADQPAKGESRQHTTPSKRPSRRSGRREGKSYAPGELLLPSGSQTADEALYLFRGCVAGERPAPDSGLSDVLGRRGLTAQDAAAEEVRRQVAFCLQRFTSGGIDPMLPSRLHVRRTFPGFLERARGRRREIGAFLRGLDLGHTEVSHLDAHGESSLQNLMEWMARIEKMIEEGEEPEHADLNQLHRGIDQLDATTEALIVDLELTLKRLRDRT